MDTNIYQPPQFLTLGTLVEIVNGGSGETREDCSSGYYHDTSDDDE